MPKTKKRKPSLLRRLVEEIQNFLHYYEGRAGATLEKAIAERIVDFQSPPRSKFHQKVVDILRQYFTKKQTKLDKERTSSETLGKESKVKGFRWREMQMARKCAICGVEASDVFRHVLDYRVLGTADQLLKSDDIPKVAVVDIPVVNLCAYCADLSGVSHPNPKIADGVRYYTDLMKHALPKLQEHIVPPEKEEKVEVDKVQEVLYLLQEALTKLARTEEASAPKRDIPKVSAVDYPEEADELFDAWKEEEGEEK